MPALQSFNEIVPTFLPIEGQDGSRIAAESPRGSVSGEGRDSIPLQSSDLPRTHSEFSQHCVHRLADRHRLSNDRVAFHGVGIAQG